MTQRSDGCETMPSKPRGYRLSFRTLLISACIVIIILVTSLSAVAFTQFRNEGVRQARQQVTFRIQAFNDSSADEILRQLRQQADPHCRGAGNSSLIYSVAERNIIIEGCPVEPGPGSPDQDFTSQKVGSFIVGQWIPLTAERSMFIGEMVDSYTRAAPYVAAIILFSGIVPTLLIALLGLWVHARAERELLLFADQCIAVGEGNLELRLSEDARTYEIGKIAKGVNEMISRLSRTVTDLRILSETLGHDVRNYVLYATDRIERVRKHALPEKADDDLIRARHALEFLDNVALKVARISIQKADSEALGGNPTDLAAVIAHSFELFAEDFEDLGFRVEKDLQSALAYVDPATIIEIANNLLSNALKYGKQGRYLAIRTFSDDGGAKLEISDRGPGIPEDDLERVFQFKARLSRDAEEEGQGFGLAIARLMARLCNAELMAINAVDGIGARFLLRFPPINRS